MIEKTAEQRRIVESNETITQVQAVAGSGKTEVAKWCVERELKRGVDPTRILCLSFSNATRDTMRRRLPTGPRVDTLHSYALELVRGRGPALTVLPEGEALTLLKRAIKGVQAKRRRHGASRSEFLDNLAGIKDNLRLCTRFFELRRAGDRSARRIASDNGLPFAAFANHVPLLRAVFQRFQKLKSKAGQIDFADMIFRGIEALRRGVSVPFTRLFVDEYQDCSPAQARFIAELARRMTRVRVFGDRLQAIYGFAGGRYTELTTLLPGVKTYPLSQSFRLTRSNAAFASAVVAQGYPRLPPIVGGRGAGPAPQLIKCRHGYQQDDAVVEVIERLTSQGVERDRMIVLAYTKGQLREQEQALLAKDVETQPLYRARGVKHVLAVLGLVRTLEKLKGQPKRKVTARLRAALDELSDERDVKGATKEAQRRTLEHALRSPSLQTQYKACAAAYLSTRGFAKTKHGADAVAEVNRWQATAARFASATKLKRHVCELVTSSKVFTNTIHQAKGGEWDYVIVLNVVDGCMPFFRAGTSKTALDEERNLFYVAITRARQQVFLIQAPYTNAKVRESFTQVSPFIADKTIARCIEVRRYAGG